MVKALFAALGATAWIGSLVGCELVVDDGKRVLASGDGGDAQAADAGMPAVCGEGCLTQSTTCQQTCAATMAMCLSACPRPAPPPCVDMCTEGETACGGQCGDQCLACLAQMQCGVSMGCAN